MDAVGNRPEAAAESAFPALLHVGLLGPVGQGQVILPGHFLQPVDLGGLQPGLFENVGAELAGIGRVERPGSGTAERHYFVEKACGSGHGSQRTNLRPAPGLAHDGHVAGVASKICYVIPHPFQGSHHVQGPHVA